MRRIHSNRRSSDRLVTLAVAIASLFLLAGVAQARTETIRWSQANMANVTGWKIYVGSASRAYTQIIDVPSPSPDGAGGYQWNIEVAGTDEAYVSMTSYNSDGVESALSNERVKGSGGGGEPPPDPPPTPGMSTPYWLD
jgi:hypothetical protein